VVAPVRCHFCRRGAAVVPNGVRSTGHRCTSSDSREVAVPDRLRGHSAHYSHVAIVDHTSVGALNYIVKPMPPGGVLMGAGRELRSDLQLEQRRGAAHGFGSAKAAQAKPTVCRHCRRTRTEGAGLHRQARPLATAGNRVAPTRSVALSAATTPSSHRVAPGKLISSLRSCTDVTLVIPHSK